MRRRLNTRRAARLALAGWAACSAGCIHNHYYGQGPMVYEGTPGVAVPASAGTICEVAPPARGLVVSQTPELTTVIGGPPRVVLNSTPMGTRPPQRGTSSRYFWERRGDNLDAIARTNVEGSLDEGATQQR